MKFSKDHLELLTKAVANQITEKEDEVFVFIGNNMRILDQDSLEEAIRTALENA
jgi:hypothetical protein